MHNLTLIEPTIDNREIILAYKNEFVVNGDSMDGTAGLIDIESFDEWYEELTKNSCEDTVREGFVPSTTYLAFRTQDNELVGMISIRHRLNDFLFTHGGHIGYSVRKSERRKGYATEMLSLALNKCINLGIERALLTCDKRNLGSKKTIVSTGGILENEIVEENRITQRYWIEIGKLNEKL